MRFPSSVCWLRPGSPPRRPHGRAGHRPPTRHRPNLERLEDRRLLASGGSAELIADIMPGSGPSQPANLVVMNHLLYFAANDGVHGDELWKSDGTTAGTVLVKDINPGSADSFPRGGGLAFPQGLMPVGNILYFWANDGVHGGELWRTDGTAAGTMLVRDINPGSGSSTPPYLNGPTMANVNGTLFFVADDGHHGAELWRSDGTGAGTVLVKDVVHGSGGSDPSWLTDVNGALFFAADDGHHGNELWKSDGTDAGTVLVKDIYSKSTSSNPQCLVNFNGTLVFSAVDGTDGLHVWKSNGTSAGTVLVKSGVNGPGAAMVEGGFTNVNGTLFFKGSDGANGDELWRTDGTAAGTRMVADIWPGSSGSDPAYLTNLNGALFFRASDPLHGGELWKSDGTAAGTVLVRNINTVFGTFGEEGSAPQSLTNVNGLLYFSADDGVHGWELWQSDGTAAGTVLVQDINPGAASSNPDDLVAMNDRLYFSADDGVHGRELWDPPPVGSVPPGAGALVLRTDTSVALPGEAGVMQHPRGTPVAQVPDHLIAQTVQPGWRLKAVARRALATGARVCLKWPYPRAAALETDVGGAGAGWGRGCAGVRHAGRPGHHGG